SRPGHGQGTCITAGELANGSVPRSGHSRHVRGDRRPRPGRHPLVPSRMTSSRRLVPVVLVCIAVTCAALAENDDEARKARAAEADDLLIVHCSLPGQIRQLGRNSSYLSARRPARTTALDCRVRGGEYVVQDRASLKTALNVWLEKARSGD